MKKVFRLAAAVISAVIMLTATGCSPQSSVEYDCEYCGRTFTSGGSVTTMYDGSEVAFCDNCMNRAKMHFVEEYYEGLY